MIRALPVVKWRPMGSGEFSLDHVTWGVGLPSATHFKMAVWLSLTVVSTGRCSKEGAEMDFPGSPLTPFWPGRPGGPAGPESPFSSRSPFKPIGPWDPIGPCLPGGPSGPGLPGWPGLPRFPAFPRRPVFPFGPNRQTVSSLAQIWFCSKRSSSLMIRFTSETVWMRFCCEFCGDVRFFLEKASFRSADYEHTHNICIMARADCMMVHSARKNIIGRDYGSRSGENSQSMNYL